MSRGEQTLGGSQLAIEGVQGGRHGKVGGVTCIRPSPDSRLPPKVSCVTFSGDGYCNFL